MNTTDLGNSAEASASKYLINSGYIIKDRNWRTKWCEVDIIASKDSTLYFVEVKYRSSLLSGSGLEYITDDKLKRMMRAAETWIQKYNSSLSYDLLAIEVSGPDYSVNSCVSVL